MTNTSQPWHRNKLFRYSANFIASIVCTESFAAFAYYSSEHTSILDTLIFALIPAVILWLIFNLVQSYDEKVRVYQREIDRQIDKNTSLSGKIEKLTIELKNLLQDAAETLELSPPFRKLLRREIRQRKLIGHFLRKCMSPALCIWDISDGDFYELVQEGIRDCHKWQGIHHGKITELQTNHPYLKDLQNVTSQRIVILTEDGVKELEDRTIVENFLLATANTPSYWIEEDKFFEIARLTYMKERLKLDDCVLHDGQVLLLRQRNTRIAILSFKGDNEPICEGIVRAFDELNLQLKGIPTNTKFKKIE